MLHIWASCRDFALWEKFIQFFFTSKAAGPGHLPRGAASQPGRSVPAGEPRRGAGSPLRCFHTSYLLRSVCAEIYL